jgi:hypothetical protein
MPSFSLSPAHPTADRRLAGLLATVLVHVALILGWQVTRTLPPVQADVKEKVMHWLHLPPLAPDLKPLPAPRSVEASPPARPSPGRAGRSAHARSPATTPAPATPPPQALTEPAPAVEQPAKPDAASILENARRSVGSIDRALRKESKPTIVTPPDSPEIRMRQGMEQARALAPTRLWEAPKVEELVNNTGDGARRTRVITGRGTYCVTERSPVTNVEMIEMHGKIRLTNCPTHEEPAKRQEWRTARD